ncbi:fibronectin type III domain-containing protein [bacterium]|nr:fibronectin type III domain-containing protein [bacterium]MBU1074430.1 fibronectin type III domain-containing protein [bacterium]MBU1676783.1 fibronectin type III domain-containing protein [bacterium]
MKHRKRIPVLVILSAVVILAVSVTAQAQEVLNYTWTAPTTGSPVDHYVVQHSEDGGAWVTVQDTQMTNSYALTAVYDVEHRVRVAGVDAEGRQGPWSIASEPYTPTLGAPGQPGQPIAVF